MEKNPKTMMNSLKKFMRAFSMAELAIILSLVGFVSSVAVGTVTKHFNDQKLEFTNVITNNEIAISLADMHASEELMGLTDEEFANKLQKHYSVEGAIINKDGTKSSGGSANLADMTYADFVGKNFAASYKDGDKVIKASDFNTVLKTARGASIALSYNKACAIGTNYVSNGTGANAYSAADKNAALGCVEGIYDVNGDKGPNKLGVDVGIISDVKGNCEGNFVMNTAGECGKICNLTTTNCKAENKTLNKNTCACECTVSCPKGQVLDKATCTCKCASTPPDFNEHYCKMDEGSPNSSCMPIPKSFTTPARCLSGGGQWYGDSCNCDCSGKDCKSRSFNYGEADSNAYCDCKCPVVKTQADMDKFKAIVRANASKYLSGEDLERAVQMTIPANQGQLISSGDCYACDPALIGTGSLSYKPKNGYCAAECNMDLQNKCNQNGDFFKWVGVLPNDPSNSCKCVCNTEAKKAQLNELNAELDRAFGGRVLAADGSSQHVWERLYDANLCAPNGWNTGRCGSCDKCHQVKNGTNAAKIVSTHLNGDKASSSIAPKYKFNEDKCLFEFDRVGLYSSYVPSTTLFHCARPRDWSICRQYVYYPGEMTISQFASNLGVSTWLAGHNPNANRPSGVWAKGDGDSTIGTSYWNNVKVALSSSYAQWYDPIVLNYTNENNITPSTIGGENKKWQNVNYKLSWNGADGYDVVNTPWIDFSSDKNNSHVFLVIVDNTKMWDMVPDVSYMFSDQKPRKDNPNEMYSTGLDQLKDEFDDHKNSTDGQGVDAGLVNKNDSKFSQLAIWWDGNEDAKATQDEIRTLDKAKITEFNTVVKRLTTTDGKEVQSDTAVFGITGQYKRLIKIGNKLSDAYLGVGTTETTCKDVCQKEEWVCNEYKCKTYYSQNDGYDKCLSWGMFGNCKTWKCKTYHNTMDKCASKEKKCTKTEQVCTTKEIKNDTKTRYVKPVYDENGKQILDKWEIILNDKELKAKEDAFQEKVEAKYQKLYDEYEAAINEKVTEQNDAYAKAKKEAYDAYIAKWQEAVAAKKAVAKTFAPTVTAPADEEANAEEDVTAPSDEEETATPSDEEDVTAPSDEEDVTAPSDEEETTTPSDEEETKAPADEEANTPTDEEEANTPTDEEEANAPSDEEEANAEEEADYDVALANLTEDEAEEAATKAGEEAGEAAKAKITTDGIVEPLRADVEVELAKSRDDAEYVTYSPREKLDSEYNERWFKYSEESKYGNEITDMKYIKVFLIDGVYYQEEIFNLSDVLFKS